jgi:O-antigen ligase
VTPPAPPSGWRATRLPVPGRQAGRFRDAVSLLTIYLVLLVAVPSRLVYEQIGSTCTPAALVGIAALLWWCATRLSPSLGGAKGPQPVRTALLVFCGVVAVSEIMGTLRAMDGLETRAADAAIFGLLAACGVAWLAADGISSVARLQVLLDRVVIAGAALATLGIVQFATDFDVARYLGFPGTQVNGTLELVQLRDGFNRVAGTAIHPIEFGAVLATIFPIALHQALRRGLDSRLRRVTPFVLIAVALPMSLSRSAFIGVAAAALVMAMGWTWRQRTNAAVATVTFLAAMRVVIPGLLGTLRNLFTNLHSDSSYVARTQHAQQAWTYIGAAPWFGRGFGTFLPQRYVLLDNQYLGALAETGIVGLLALLSVFCSALLVAQRTAQTTLDPDLQNLGRALAAAAAVPLVTFLTCDEFSFPMAIGMTFLMLGCAGALWRLTRDNAMGVTM